MLNVPMVSAMTVLALDQEAEGTLVAKEQLSLEFPLTKGQVHALRRTLLDASRAPAADLCKFIKCSDIEELLRLLREDLKQEPTLVEVSPSEGVTVTVVGDTHGQFHDVCHMYARGMDMVGDPSPTNFYVFNGDYVDRGAWGLETLLLIGAWRLANPHAVTMLRGNHETALCSMVYGFKGELVAKLGRGKWKDLYSQCKHVFAALPLAALVASSTLVLHGGLFRKRMSRQQTARKRSRSPEVGSLADLRAAHKGGLDPSGRGAYRLATDVLWSDPVPEPGFALNASRGVGTVFGPDVTDAFLRANGLRLVLRSHEGPDAREGRDDVLPMSRGYAEDHVGASGMLATVFSAPDYPQFQIP
ncbi:hypothetical protein H632_c441p0, partial [Helicosporidium sp. ATCC 50920]